MDSIDLITIVESATVVVTLIMIASGFPGCMKMYRTKATDNVPFMLFLVSCLVSSFGLQYGMMTQNRTLVFINLIALLVWSAYATTYLFVSKSRTLPTAKVLGIGTLYWAHQYYLRFLPSVSVIPTIGHYLIVYSTIAYVVPAMDILTMVREKSAQSCDLFLLLGGTLSASVWYLYGYLVNDFNIYFPSIPALCVSACKFFLLFLYGSGGKTSRPAFQKKSSDIVDTDLHENLYKVRGREGLRQRN